MADQITASGDRSVVVGTVINSSINTGDHNQFFVGEYERLRDAYVEPWPVFERCSSCVAPQRLIMQPVMNSHTIWKMARAVANVERW